VNDRSVDDCAGIDLDDPEVVRKLIHRLIAAGQWKTLVRLLHAIGVL
jgi:hypothetical protein